MSNQNMSKRDRDDSGQFEATVTTADVMRVFESVDGPAITSADVADELDCSREVARKRLHELEDEGRVERRKSGRTVLWWQTTEHDYERAIGALAGTGIADEMQEVRENHREEWDDGTDSS
jgi:predicted ArsR family transcriptional regulator